MSEGFEARVKGTVIDCWACQRAAKHGALHLSGEAILRQATIHLIGGGGRPLCERTPPQPRMFE